MSLTAPELAKYINERLVGPQKDSDKELTERSILIALRKNCPMCGGKGTTTNQFDAKCSYCSIPEKVDVPNNNTKRSTTRKKTNKRK